MNVAETPSSACGRSIPRTSPRSARIALAGLLGIAALWLVVYGRNLDAFLDFGSLVLTAGGTLALLLISFGPSGFADAFSALIGPEKIAATETCRHFFRMAATYSLGCGVLGALLGTVVVLTQIADPAMLGSGLALALISQIYGVVQALTCYCLSVRIERRMTTWPQTVATSGRSVNEAAFGAGAGTLTLLLVMFTVLVAIR